MTTHRRSIMGAAGTAALALAGALLVGVPAAHAATGGQGIVCNSWDDGSTAYAECTGVDPADTMIPWHLEVDCVHVSATGRTYRHHSVSAVSDGTVVSAGCGYFFDLDGYEAVMD